MTPRDDDARGRSANEGIRDVALQHADVGYVILVLSYSRPILSCIMLASALYAAEIGMTTAARAGIAAGVYNESGASKFDGLLA